ncbi:PaaX family transcriptional regulator C-terminal domain-containing protein [Mycobacterium sp. 852002-51057_SCH5723018]|uniref:PaaX family transcriptional regulator C-terminal domain-containing protein n=1 Tax=Mycobacterium sp. 852002-51057_SCH5723018 TaxID=1834094 RepID=UPI0007FDE00B|nr:PaaX family transcriptional regulator C-terminal domain-containing protein [Mycobacterium sp. 852002-51057_SCH5723018]OBG29509.1 PaaX domain-containing protein, C- domain protein [Mycobacterium sp. 852002-51057_SCH5723018]
MLLSSDRLTARSVILSLLLGLHPPAATSAELIRLTSDYAITETAMRVALTRMVSNGDLVRSVDGYRLSDRLLARQRRQDDALRPPTRVWRGAWLTVVITTVGIDPRTRADTRKVLYDNRLAELREGVWMRPDNLRLDLPADLEERARILYTYDNAPAELAGLLWDLPGWAQTGRVLLDELNNASDEFGQFVAAATIMRHLISDPVLPDNLLPVRWPGDELRMAYAEFAAEISDRRYQSGVMAT